MKNRPTQSCHRKQTVFPYPSLLKLGSICCVMLAMLISIAALSCSDSSVSNNGTSGNAFVSPATESELAAKIVGKWDFSDPASPYAFIEFTEDGHYILVERAAQVAAKTASPATLSAAKNLALPSILSKTYEQTELGESHFGTYTLNGAAKTVTLAGFGTIANITFDAKNARISFDLEGAAYRADGTPAGSTYNSDKTTQLARTWLLSKITAAEDGSGADLRNTGDYPAALTAMWSKAGTYLVFYNNADGATNTGKIGLSEWEWSADESGFVYSWTNWAAQKEVKIISLSDNALKIKEDQAYYHFNLLGVSSSGIMGNLTEGATITATINNPNLVNETCSYQWKADGIDINGATNQTYVLTANEIGKTILFAFVCGTGDNIYNSGTGQIAGNPAVKPKAPTITTHPQSQDSEVGASISLTIFATCDNGTASYKWFEGATELGEGTAYNLITSAGTKNIFAKAYCTVNETISEAQNSNVAIIRSPNTPTISGLEDKVCEIGSSVCMLSASSNGNGIITWQWLNGDDDSPINGETNSAYNAPTQALGVYQYKVRVANTVGSATATATSEVVNVRVLNSVLQCNLPEKSKAGTPIASPLSCSNSSPVEEEFWENGSVDWANPIIGTFTSIATAKCEGIEQIVNCGQIKIVGECQFQKNWCGGLYNTPSEVPTTGINTTQNGNTARCHFVKTSSGGYSATRNAGDGGIYVYEAGYACAYCNGGSYTTGVPTECAMP